MCYDLHFLEKIVIVCFQNTVIINNYDDGLSVLTNKNCNVSVLRLYIAIIIQRGSKEL